MAGDRRHAVGSENLRDPIGGDELFGLASCLERVALLQYCDAWELIVVDNDSSDNTSRVITAFAGQVKFPVNCVVERNMGLGNARNAGLIAARGVIIAFTDDDCYVASDFLQNTMAAFCDDRIGYVTGRVSLHDPADYPITINESRVPSTFPSARYLPTGAVTGANMAFRRSVLNEIGGFDPLFGAGALFPAEDCDAAARASLAGWDGCYDPAIRVAHHHRRRAESISRLLRDYDVGRGAYHAKLIVECGALRLGLVGWRELIKHGILDLIRADFGQLCRWPVRAYWELYGAVGYTRHWLARHGT